MAADDDDQGLSTQSYLALLAHEIASPLIVAFGYAEMLQRSYRGDERVDDLLAAIRAIKHSVDGILALVRDTGGATESELLSLDALVGRVLENLSYRLPGREVRVAVPPGATVLATRGALEIVLSNIVSNALKYSSDVVDIVATMDCERFWHLAVLDRGPGLSEPDAALVFEPFFRARGTRDTVPGIGLGLTVSMQLADHNGWGLTYLPRPGGGSQFVLALPALTPLCV